MGNQDGKPSDPQRPKDKENPWLGDDELMDKDSLLRNGLAKRCERCGRLTHIQHLRYERCPDCR